MPEIGCLLDRGRADRRQTSRQVQLRTDGNAAVSSRQMRGATPECDSGRTFRDPEPAPTRPASQRSRTGHRIPALSTELDRVWTTDKVLRSPVYWYPAGCAGCGSSKFMHHADHILIGQRGGSGLLRRGGTRPACARHASKSATAWLRLRRTSSSSSISCGETTKAVGRPCRVIATASRCTVSSNFPKLFWASTEVIVTMVVISKN